MDPAKKFFKFDKKYITEQYVKEVMEYSNFYGDSRILGFHQSLVVGPPHKYVNEDATKYFPQAIIMTHYGNWWNECPSKTEEFMPRSCKSNMISDDFLVVYFKKAVYPISMTLYELRNVGSVIRVWALQPESIWILLWEGEPENKSAGPIFTPRTILTNMTAYKTNVYRLEFNQRGHEYHTEFATVTLTGSSMPPKVLNTKILPVGCETSPLVAGQSPHQEFAEYLQRLRNMLMEQNLKALAESGDIQDHLSQLPNELILRIFTSLDLKSLRRCRSVSRRMKQLAEDPLLYKEISLKPFWYCMDGKALLSLIPDCNLVTKLDASWCGQSKLLIDDFIRFLEQVGTNLTHLRLNSATFVTDKLLLQIAKFCQNLKELELRECSTPGEIGFKALSELHKLERLDLYGASISDPELISILAANQKLKHLGLGNMERMNNMHKIFTQVVQTNTQLISLNLWNCSAMQVEELEFIAELTNLEELDLSWCKNLQIPEEYFFDIAHGCRKLRKLFLTGLHGTVDEDLEPFAKFSQNLEQLSLFGLKLISEHIVLRFLTACPNLKYLDVNFCDGIPNEQIQNWREIFPQVSIKSCCTGRILKESLD